MALMLIYHRNSEENKINGRKYNCLSPKKCDIKVQKGDGRSLWIAIMVALKKAVDFLFISCYLFEHFKGECVGFGPLFIQLDECFHSLLVSGELVACSLFVELFCYKL